VGAAIYLLPTIGFDLIFFWQIPTPYPALGELIWHGFYIPSGYWRFKERFRRQSLGVD
jgi:hypothetical protein